MSWIYKKYLPDRMRGIERDLGESERGFEFSWNAFAAYDLADRLILPVLQDLVMDSMRSTSVMEGSWYASPLIQTPSDHSIPSSLQH